MPKVSFTPLFNKLDETLLFVGQKTRVKSIAAKHKHLSSKKRVTDIKNVFDCLLSQNSHQILDKVVEFLNELNLIRKDPELKVELDRINAMSGNNNRAIQAKQEALKKLIIDKKLVEICARYWDMYLQSEAGSKNHSITDDILSMIDGANHKATEDFKHASAQGVYDPFTKWIMDIMDRIELLFNVLIVVAGGEVPTSESKQTPSGQGEHDNERWDEKLRRYIPN